MQLAVNMGLLAVISLLLSPYGSSTCHIACNYWLNSFIVYLFPECRRSLQVCLFGLVTASGRSIQLVIEPVYSAA